MRILITTLFAGLILLLLYTIYELDTWLGILAFRFYYITFCMLFAAIVTVIMIGLTQSRKFSAVAGLVVLALFISLNFIGTPSARILRSVLIDVQPGTSGDEIEELVINAYQGSGYKMPQITRTDDHISVSLFTQAPGDSTSAMFYLDGGLVVNDSFFAD